jgi:hypothetical protein
MPAICSSLKLSPTLLITAVGGAGTRISEHVQQQQYGATRPSVEDDRARLTSAELLGADDCVLATRHRFEQRLELWP